LAVTALHLCLIPSSLYSLKIERAGRTSKDGMALSRVSRFYKSNQINNRFSSMTMKGNTYHIYKQDLSELDMFSRLPVWVALLEQKIGRKVEDDDYVFPYIAPNGILHPKKALSHDQVQCLLTEFCQGAGLVKNFTTHCLRRGGAQYRFIHAPIGKRWSLTIIRWWGGWAEGK
jgi:hypothetical protein